MRTILLAFSLGFLLVNPSTAQKILGKYEQDALVAPDEYRDSEDDVSVTKDPNSTKKIWISNLIPNQKFYAVMFNKTNDLITYSVPAQKVGNYQINLGCITLDDEDLKISLNNKQNCMGMSQKDYDTPVSVGKNGTSAGGVKVGKDGSVSTGGVDVKNGEVRVNTKSIMSGIQYMGHKQGSKKKDDDN
jgi:hypothetical protein